MVCRPSLLTAVALVTASLIPTAVLHAQLPAGATVVAAGLKGPRGLTFGPDGTLYIAEAGSGGTVAAPASCPAVAPPTGPNHGGFTAQITRVLPGGQRSVVTNGLPSTVSAMGDVLGVADVTFLDGELYALIDGGGCSNGNPTFPNSIVRVDTKTGKRQFVADLSAFAKAHPAAYPISQIDPEGDPYSFVAAQGRLFSVEANSGRVFATSPDGSTELIRDISLAYAHNVPTSIAAAPNGNLYVGTLGIFPIRTEQDLILTLSRDSFFIDTTPGLETPASEVGKFHLVHSRAGFTTIIGLKLGPDGLLYALELSDAPGYPTPGTGKVVRLNRSGTIETVVSGLSVPTGMTFGPDHALYISNLGAAPAGAGQVLRVPITF